jgi:hypothetical protein
VSPKSDEVRLLLDRFRTEAPEAARSLVRETARGVLDGLSGEISPGEWVKSRAGMIAITGGVGLFAAGFLLGRATAARRSAVLGTGVAATAGLAAGWLIASQAAGARSAGASGTTP